MLSFDGKVVVITGAGSGIGRATALRFARERARVHVVDLREDRAAKVASEIALAGGRARAHAVDCSRLADVEALAERVYAEDRRVDVLHNNAGVGHGAPIEKTTIADWERVLGVNLWGTIYGIHAFVPRMLAQGGEAHIVNTASGLGLFGAPGMSPYCASKFAVVGISEVLAVELADRGIGVTVVCPGIIDTNIVAESKIEGRRAGFVDQTLEFFHKRGASADVVADDLVEGVRRRLPLVITPRRHVLPLWALKRATVPGYVGLAKRLSRKFLDP